MSNILFSALQSALVSYFYSFKESFLFYPIIFAIGGFSLFLLTSRLDELFGRSFYTEDNVITSYLEPVLFAGSPNAARSILATVAAGWATILGVVFSVTLITLQLSVTKYTAEIIKEFENSRINQFTLGLFILTVTFSLLVLKTVRTGEDGSPTFTPILGVNIAVYLAVIVLFVFVIFLHNISSYLTPDTLIGKIVNKVQKSIGNYEKRVPDRRFIFKINNQGDMRELSKIRSPRRGIIRSIDWRRISNHVQKQSNLKPLENEQPYLFLKWMSTIGEYTEKDGIIAKLYVYGNFPSDISQPEANKQKGIEQTMQEAVFSGLDIAQARRISSDPHYGLEVMRNIATKAISQSDTATAVSCISGLFRICYENAGMRQLVVAPFMLPLSNGNPNNSGKYLTTVSTGEKDISEEVLFQLSLIYQVSSKSEECRIPVAEHFAKNYVSLGRQFLDENKTEEFEGLTEWYSKQTSLSLSQYTLEFRCRLRLILAEFRRDVETNHSYAKDSVRIYLDRLFASEA